MPKYSYFFAQGEWEKRTSLVYTPAGQPDKSGVSVDAFGNHIDSSAANNGIIPPLAFIEELDNAIYVKYAGNNVVIKVVKS